MMNQTEKNFWIDVIIFTTLLITTLSGLLLWLGNPEKGIISLGSSFSLWQTMHLYAAIINLTGIILHIVSHWKWLKAMRGRPMPEMPKKLRANRIVNRVMWISFIATTLFGMLTMVFSLAGNIFFVQASSRLHVGFGFAWLTLAIVHLVFHRKWIVYTLRGFQINRKPI
ncbi:MAG: hypothetical protein C0410_03660 [Anaerolinea sp.]|nr:hypothetical protein [Anaerolinea sp.]